MNKREYADWLVVRAERERVAKELFDAGVKIAREENAKREAARIRNEESDAWIRANLQKGYVRVGGRNVKPDAVAEAVAWRRPKQKAPIRIKPRDGFSL